MWTKGEGGLFTGSTSEGGSKSASANRTRSTKTHSAVKTVKDIVKVQYSAASRDMFHDNSAEVPVVINPTLHDLKELGKKNQFRAVRMIATKKGDVVAWDAAKAIHYHVAKAMGEPAKHEAIVEFRPHMPPNFIYANKGKLEDWVRIHSAADRATIVASKSQKRK